MRSGLHVKRLQIAGTHGAFGRLIDSDVLEAELVQDQPVDVIVLGRG